MTFATRLITNEFWERRRQTISYQVLRIEQFSKGSLGKIGGETERTSALHRNEDIDDERTPLNYYFKRSDGGLTAQWNKTVNELNATFKETKKSHAFEGMIITSDKAFFERLGYVQGETPPPKLLKFFEDCYLFALKEIGYHGTDKNVLSAVVHLDETTPHLQLYYIPLVDHGKKKVYAKGSDGKVLRNAKGSPVQEKDENGKGKFEFARLSQPKICSSDFWEMKGAQCSFGDMQDRFYEEVAYRYGLERGEVGSNKHHTTKYEWQMQQREQRLKEFDEYLAAFEDAMQGKTPFFKGDMKKQIVGLIAKVKQLEQEKALSEKDREALYNRMQELECKYPKMRESAEIVALLKEFAPDEYKTAKAAAEQRRSYKPKLKTKSSSNFKF